MKKKTLFIFIFVFMLFLCDKYSINANAVRKDDFDIYIETGPALEKKKVYLTDEMVYFLRGSKIEILDETETVGWWLFEKTVHHYYYMASPYIDEIVYTRKIDDRMDSLVYMVKQLEFYAADYKLDHNTSRTVNDLVLGYLRCINKEYSESYSDSFLIQIGFAILAGTYEDEFVRFVKTEEQKKKNSFGLVITIPEFFGRYVNRDNFNKVYGEQNDWNKKIITPIESAQIDVSHFFAVIDTTRHINIENPVMLGFHLVSWLGDLHQATFYRNEDVIKDLPIDFKKDILDEENSYFSTSDFIADIDGYNIGFNILLNDKNNELKVSDSINSYYEILKQNSENRYKIFIKSLSFINDNRDVDDGYDVRIIEYVNMTPYSGINGFRYVVCTNMGVNYMNYKAYGETLYYNKNNPIFKFMCENNGIKKDYPCATLRENMSKAFIDYVLEKAGYNYEIEE